MWPNPRILMALLSLMLSFAIVGCEGRNRNGNVALPEARGIWKAVEDENLEEIRNYVRGGGSLEIEADDPLTSPLRHALALKKLKSYQELLSLGAKPDKVCADGQTATHLAAYQDNPVWVGLALEAGADPNAFNQAAGLSKGTPMLYAISGGNGHRVENVRHLIKHGAKLNAPIDNHGRQTALFQASAGWEFEIAYVLLEAGADYNAPGPMEDTFIYHFRNMLPDDYPHMPHYHKWVPQIWEWLAKHGVDPRKAVWDGNKWKFD